jgi:hypothetical protein
MFGEFSLEYGAVTLVATFSFLIILSLLDTVDAEKMFSRRDK